jgi:formylglycine-generating enzyme required for sulfatase activity
MKTIFKKSVTLLLILFFCSKIFANGITISNVSFLPNTSQIQFDVSWENSWRSDALNNWDAAYIFAKFKTQGGSWETIVFNNNNSTVPTGYSLFAINPSTVNFGMLIYRTLAGSGTSIVNNVKLSIGNSTAFNANIALGIYDVKVFGIEMVHIPQGTFWAGDGSIFNPFKSIYGAGSLYVNTGLLKNLWPNTFFDPLTPSPYLSTTNSNYPTGYDAFYCMKYELSQGAYRDFLNTLTYTQQNNHVAISPNSAASTLAMGTTTVANFIEIATAGVSSTAPAVYGCDANNNNIYNETADGEYVACNYLTWPDLAAYLTWAGLVPMTELQFEKVCRGPLQPVTDEFAWGNTNIGTSTLTISNANATNEIISNASTTAGNASFFNTNVNRPLRNGVFATPTSNRITSGGSFYGVMEMSGNIWERVITTAKVEGLFFNGSPNSISPLNNDGFCISSNYPGSAQINSIDFAINGTIPALGLMYRGGAFSSIVGLKISDRTAGLLLSNPDNLRSSALGGRGVLNLQ